MITSSSSEPLSSLSDRGATSYLQISHTSVFSHLILKSTLRILQYRTTTLIYWDILSASWAFYLTKYPNDSNMHLGVLAESKLPSCSHTHVLTQGSSPARPPAGLLWEHPHQLESCHCPHEWLSLGGHSSDWSHPKAIAQGRVYRLL